VRRLFAAVRALIRSGQLRHVWTFVPPARRQWPALLGTTWGVFKAVALRRPRTTLIRLCTNIIHVATFTHTWYNEAQQIDGGDPHFATLGVKRSALSLEGPLAEWREATAPHARDVSFQLFLAYTLTHVNLGFMARGEEPEHAAEDYDQTQFGDVALLRALVAAYHKNYAGLGTETAAEVMTKNGQPMARLRARINT